MTKLIRNLTEIIAFWIFPILSLYASHQFWEKQDLFYGFKEAIFWIPVITMTLVVFTGAGFLKMWKFNSVLTIKGVIPQIGFIYSAFINILAIIIYSNFGGIEVLSSPLKFSIFMGIGSCIFGHFYDAIVLKTKLLEVYTGPFYKKLGVIKILASYAPQFFTMIGIILGLAISCNSYYFHVLERTGDPWFIIIATSILFAALPIIYLVSQKAKKKT